MKNHLCISPAFCVGTADESCGRAERKGSKQPRKGREDAWDQAEKGRKNGKG